MLFSLLRVCTPYPLAWDDLSLHSEPALNVTFSKLTLRLLSIMFHLCPVVFFSISFIATWNYITHVLCYYLLSIVP